MLRLTTFIAALGAATSAWGLSCMAPNAAQDFNRLNAVPEVYVVGLGTLTAAEPLPDIRGPADRQDLGPQAVRGVFAFDGRFLSGDGDDAQEVLPVTVEVTCLAHWCGGFPMHDTETLVFLRQHDDGSLLLEIGPCGGALLAEPTRAQVEAIRQCFRNGGCGVAEEAAFGLPI